MSGTENTRTGRYLCKVSGCGKSFQRREHLGRHARSHSEPRFVCRVCQKEFTRSDSLQRHLGLHGEKFQPSPSGRIKRACITCHSSKIKCDGEQPCTRCRKKDIKCTYDQQQEKSQVAVSKNGTAVADAGASTSRGPPVILEASPVTDATSTGYVEEDAEAQKRFAERLCAALGKSKGPIDWSEIRIGGDAAAKRSLTYGPKTDMHPPSDDESWPIPPNVDASRYLDLYFTHIHHRWPILHSPTFDAENVPPVLLSCVIMIGAFIHGTSHAKGLAMTLYTCAVDWISPRLGQLTSDESIDNFFTLALCQASLLCIVSGFYCGNATVLSSAVMIRSMLITALREIGLFNPEIPVSYDRPGYFVPLRLLKEALRQRLSTCLFKIDTYLSILRGQPAFLTPEELHFTLPTTLALWNCDGLDIFQVRHSIEPEARGQTTICQTILEPDLEFVMPVDGLMLAEDIQLGFCAMHSKIWRLLERSRGSPEIVISDAIEKAALKRRLESWKRWLAKIPIQKLDNVDLSRDQLLAMRWYYGIEDHSKPGWQLIVFNRHKDLIFDVLMLYHLLSIHLNADIRVLTQLAKDLQQANPTGVCGEMNSKARAKRDASTRTWAESASARRTLCHATDVLVSYNNTLGVENNQFDPITFVALSTAALVVWAYCSFVSKGCPDCLWGSDSLPVLSTPILELANWNGPMVSQIYDDNKENWIEMGGCPAQLTGIDLCICNISVLVAKFGDCIQEGWHLADTIAPGIFRQGST